MSANVTATMNETQSMSSCFNPTATRIGETFAYCLLFVVSLAGNILIGIIVYKEKALRTPINILIVNMAISDLLYPIIRFPLLFVRLNTASHWLLSSPLGQAFCKLSCFATDVSSAVSIQSLVLIAVDRFVVVCGISFPFLADQFKAMQAVHSRHLDRRRGSLWPIIVYVGICRVSRRAGLSPGVEGHI